MAPPTSEGWAKPMRSQRVHFFRSARSLCGKWSYFGDLEIDNGEPSTDDCAACARRRVAERAKEDPPHAR